TNEGVSEALPPIESDQGEGATSNDDVGPSDKSLLRSFRLHRAKSIALGQDLKAFKSLKVGGAGNLLSLKKLKEHYAYKLEKVLSDGTAAAAKMKKGLTARFVARAYMMYVLGSFLFLTKKRTDVSARYLVLFAKDKVAKKWSWRSAVLAHMYCNLGAASRDDERQFVYCTTLLESWIFAHFPKLVGIPKEMDSDAYEHCTCWKWVTDRYSGTTLLNFKEVAWDPYKDKRDSPHAFKEVTFFYGALANDDVGIHQKKPANVNEHGDTPVYQSEDIAEQYDASHHEYASQSPNINLNDQQITTLNEQLQKLKEDKEKEFETNINLRETLKEKTSECDLLKETIEQIKTEIELKCVVDEQCALEFTDLPRQLDAKILECKNLEEKNTSLEAELRQKSGLEDCNQNLFVELNKKCKKIESLKAVNAILMEQIDMQFPPAIPLVVLQSHQPVSDTTLAKKYEALLITHEDVKKKLIAKEDFRQKLVNAAEMMKSLEANNSEWEV
ncbi:hypothetical protein GIB67_010568, partial [Kingdonia uniflora]